MEFTTIRLAHKRSEIEIESLTHYDIYADVSTIAELHSEFKIYKGKKFFDMIGLVDPWNVAISENFKTILEENKITGWKCYPIKIIESDLKYYILEITGRAGKICELDEDRDRIYGTIQVDKDTWDGSDIFHLENTGIRVCTSKVRELIEKSIITNLEFEDLDKY